MNDQLQSLLFPGIAQLAGGARNCCETFDNEQHLPTCPRMLALNSSYAQDYARWIEGYIEVPKRLAANALINNARARARNGTD